MISQKALEQFKAIWKDEFNSNISDELAMEKATSLLVLFDATYRPIKKEWLNKNEYDNEIPKTNHNKSTRPSASYQS